MMTRFRSAFLLALAPAALVAQTPTYISPQAAVMGPGNTNNTIPFRQASIHYQQVHSSSSFSSQQAGPITRLQFIAKSATTGGAVDLDIYMAQCPHDSANASATFANNVATGTETMVFSSTNYQLPNVAANVWGAGDFKLTSPYIFIPGKHFSLRMVIRSNSSTTYTLDCFSDWRFTARQGNGCQHPQATQAATHSATYRSPGQVWDLNGWSWLNKAIPALLTFGASNTQYGAINLPFDLAPLGARGCLILNDWLLVVPGTTQAIASGFIGIKLQSPADATLIGKTTYSQYVFLDAAANALGMFTSEGGAESNIPAPNGIARIYAIGNPGATTGTLGPEFAVPIGLN